MSVLGGIGAISRKLDMVGSQGLLSFLEPGFRVLQYGANSTYTNLMPSAGDLINTYNQSLISADMLRRSLRVHGIQFPDDDPGRPEGRYWRKVIEGSQTFYTPDQIGRLLARGTFTQDEAIEFLSRLGYQDANIRQNVFDLLTQPVPYVPLIDLLRRGEYTEAQARSILGELGYLYRPDQDKLLSLAAIIPGPSDLIRMVIREAFNPQQVAMLGLDDEYDESPGFHFWAAKQGLGSVRVPGPDTPWNPFDFARGYWRAHWQLPSPTQVYEMLHRLRPNRLHLYKFGGLDPGPVGVDIVRANLKANDYAPTWRDRLAAISYRVLGRIDLRRMFQLGVLGSSDVDSDFAPGDPISTARRSVAGRELHEQYQDMGYNPVDAARLVLFSESQERVRKSKLVIRSAKSKILEAYELGVIPRSQAIVELHKLSLEDPEQLASFLQLPFGEQAVIAERNFAVVVSITYSDFAASVDTAKVAVKAARTRYLKGVIDRPTATNQLQVIGITNERIDRYLRLWDLERTVPKKQFETSLLLKYARNGIISVSELTIRLGNLGWGPDDIEILISGLSRDISLDAQRQRERDARTAEQRERARLRQIRLLEQERERVIRRLARTGSVPQLDRWFTRGIIGEDDVRRRLGVLGWPTEDAVNKLEEMRQHREEYRRRPIQRQREPQPTE